jgi:hypothetical protein
MTLKSETREIKKMHNPSVHLTGASLRFTTACDFIVEFSKENSEGHGVSP